MKCSLFRQESEPILFFSSVRVFSRFSASVKGPNFATVTHFSFGPRLTRLKTDAIDAGDSLGPGFPDWVLDCLIIVSLG